MEKHGSLYLRQSCDDGTDKKCKEQKRGGQQASQRFPWTGLEVVVYVE